MDLSRNNFDGFDKFYSENKAGAKIRYGDLHDQFKLTFEEIITLGDENFGTPQKRRL